MTFEQLLVYINLFKEKYKNTIDIVNEFKKIKEFEKYTGIDKSPCYKYNNIITLSQFNKNVVDNMQSSL